VCDFAPIDFSGSSAIGKQPSKKLLDELEILLELLLDVQKREFKFHEG